MGDGFIIYLVVFSKRLQKSKKTSTPRERTEFLKWVWGKLFEKSFPHVPLYPIQLVVSKQ